MLPKVVNEIYGDYTGTVLKSAITKFQNGSWYVVNGMEDGTMIYGFNNKKAVEDWLTEVHTEGSHSDHDTYEVYEGQIKRSYDVKAVVI